MTTLSNFLPPPPEPYLIYSSERITCNHFTSATPELVHHSAILRAVDPLGLDHPCGTCGQELAAGQPAYHCSICHRPVCAACAEKDGYTLEPHHLDPAEADQPPMLVWDLDRRDFLIREIKEQAWNAQEGRCGQCHESMDDISRTSIINVPSGPMLLCDHPCAARAMGRDELLPPGNYPTDPIRIVADPRHGVPQDWLNVHFEMSLPDQSDEVGSVAFCWGGMIP